MSLRSVFISLGMIFTISYANTCEPFYLYNEELIHITNEEYIQFQSNHEACADYWLNWQCCKCTYYNGYAFNTCQNCSKPKCK